MSKLTHFISDVARNITQPVKSVEGTVAKDLNQAKVLFEDAPGDVFHAAESGASSAIKSMEHAIERPYTTAHDGFVALDAKGNVVGGQGPGVALKDMDAPKSPLDPALGFITRGEQGQVSFTLPNGKRITSETDGAGLESLPLAALNGSGVDPAKGGLLKVGVSTPDGAGDQAHVLALPKDYDGPVFVCDMDDTLRATSYKDVLEGKNQAPIPGARELLDQVAAKGIPIIYLSAGSSSMHKLNETFLKQMPPGILLDRTHVGLKGMLPINSVQAQVQAQYKTQVLGELKSTYPNVKLFGLGDDKYGDAMAYTNAGATEYIHDVAPNHDNVPANFNGVLTKSYTPDFIARVASDLQKAIDHSASFGGSPVS